MRWSRDAAIVIASIFLALPARAQEQEPVRTIPFDGPEIVCHILHSLDMKPILKLEDAAEDPEQTAIIVLGHPHVLPELHKSTGGLKEFLKKGGNLLIATDYPLIDPSLSIHISGTPVRTPNRLRKAYAYREELECPRVIYAEPDLVKFGFDDPPERILQQGRDARDHPLFSFLHKEIATNCPSNVDVFEGDPSLQDLLVYPFGSFRLPGGDLRAGQLRYVVGSRKDAPPHGRALYIAGHGMFMNGMMLQSDNDNFQFTRNAVLWLREGPKDTKRARALLIVNGEIITDFDMKLTPPPPPIPIPPLKMLNRLIRGLENERFFHRVLGELLGSNLGRVVAVLAGLATFVLLLYGAKKFMAGRHHLETAVPSLIGPQSAVSATDAVEQRQQALLRQGDYWDEARHVVLAWFRQEFDVTPKRWHAGVEANFHIDAFFWVRWYLQRQADYVLRLAREAEPTRISRHQFFLVFEALQELSQALKEGRLALLVEGKNVRQM